MPLTSRYLSPTDDSTEELRLFAIRSVERSHCSIPRMPPDPECAAYLLSLQMALHVE